MKIINKIHRLTYGDKAFYAFSTGILLFLLVVTIYPIYFTLIASISDMNAVNRGEVLFVPKGINFGSYIRVFKNQQVLLGFKNTFFYMAVGTSINMIMTITAGYGLSVKYPGRNIMMFLIVFTMYFGGGLIPTYFIYKDLGILNTVWVMLLPGAVNAYNLIVARTFISNIPNELFESAEIDGCSRLRYLFSIVVPLSTVLIAVLTLFYAVGHWNSYFNALIFLNNRNLIPLQLVLRDILLLNAVSLGADTKDPIVAAQINQLKEQLKFALIIVSSLPVLILYPFLQKYFIKGIMIGSIKG
jgi:putative aldouronate transport system permease protein